MQVEMRLKQVLKKYHLDSHGVLQRIAREADIHRHTVAKVYRNDAPNISLETVGKMCDWLRSKGVPDGVLPQALFGARPSSLWHTIAAPGTVTLYLGEYQQQPPVPTLRWISRRDAFVHSRIVEELSSPAVVGSSRPTFRTRYVPFELGAGKEVYSDGRFQEGVKRSKQIFEEMRSQTGSSSAVLIGSQLVNYMVEHLVADLFEVEPFRAPTRRAEVPFYMSYRDKDRSLPSCFGGRDTPAGHKGIVVPGIYYRGKGGRWEVIDWTTERQDAGVVITVYDPRMGSFELVVFGFSGIGTAAMGDQVTRNPDRFWHPDDAAQSGRQIKIYICRIGVSGVVPDQTEHEFHIESVDVVKAYRY